MVVIVGIEPPKFGGAHGLCHAPASRWKVRPLLPTRVLDVAGWVWSFRTLSQTTARPSCDSASVISSTADSERADATPGDRDGCSSSDPGPLLQRHVQAMQRRLSPTGLIAIYLRARPPISTFPLPPAHFKNDISRPDWPPGHPRSLHELNSHPFFVLHLSQQDTCPTWSAHTITRMPWTPAAARDMPRAMPAAQPSVHRQTRMRTGPRYQTWPNDAEFKIG